MIALIYGTGLSTVPTAISGANIIPLIVFHTRSRFIKKEPNNSHWIAV
jgi:hypothetical protein